MGQNKVGVSSIPLWIKQLQEKIQTSRAWKNKNKDKLRKKPKK